MSCFLLRDQQKYQNKFFVEKENNFVITINVIYTNGKIEKDVLYLDHWDIFKISYSIDCFLNYLFWWIGIKNDGWIE